MVDMRERLNDAEETLRTLTQGVQSEIWTSLPGIITAVNLQACSVSVQPAVKGQMLQPDGTYSYVDMPLLTDCPIQWQRGGGYTITLPINEGDECLVVFSSRCIDGWWQSGGVQAPPEMRMHDLSDGFVLVGPFSQKTKIADISSTTAQLRSDDGLTYVEVDRHNLKVTAKGNKDIVLDTPKVTCTGNLIVAGDVRISGRWFLQHVHRDTEPGAGTSGVPS